MRKKVLNLGGGNIVVRNTINVDIVDYGENVVHDLNVVPYPFAEDEFDVILCHHILEHLRDFHATMMEVWRIAKNGARIHVLVPLFLNTKYFGDPSHRIPFGIRSFDNYEVLGDRRLRFYEKWKLRHRTNYGTPGIVQILSRRFNVTNFWLLRWVNVLVNLEPVIYERLFAGILSPEECEFELEVIKGTRPSKTQENVNSLCCPYPSCSRVPAASRE